MVFGVVVTNVGASGVAVNVEVAPAGAIPDPLEAHVDCFRPFLIDGVIGKSNCCCVIEFYGSVGLSMSEFFECCTG